MTYQMSDSQQKRTTRRLIRGDVRNPTRLATFLALVLVLVTCSPPSANSPEVMVQTALPTPTLEPTFTPSPKPAATPEPSPTATQAEPTPTSTPAEPTPTPTPQTSLSGRILDQDTDQPITGAKVSAGTNTATTDADGRYTLTGLPPGQYVLSVAHADYDPGLSSIFSLVAEEEHFMDLTLYAPDSSPYPEDPMLTNPLDPNGAPTAEDAERLARLQGMTGDVVNIRETSLSGEYLVNYKIGDDVRAAVAEIDHDVWELTDDAGRPWWILKVCGNLASLLPAEVPIATPKPISAPLMAEVVVDGLILRECASEECAEVGAVELGARVEVVGCTSNGAWCHVGLPGGGIGWCTGRSLRHLAVAEAVPVVKAVLPIAIPATSDATIHPGLVVTDPELDVSVSWVDITQVSSTLSGETLTAIFLMRDLPPELTYNRVGLEDNEIDYQWGVWIDVDNNPETGTDFGQSKGEEYVILAFHAFFEGEPRSITLPYEDGLNQLYVGIQGEYRGTKVFADAILQVDSQSNTLTLVGDIPGITPESRLVFRAYSDDGTNSIEDVAGCVTDCQ